MNNENRCTDSTEMIDTRPEILTSRLLLRPFAMSDAPRLQNLLNDREIASNTRTINFPYPDGEAERWIGTHVDAWLEGRSAIFAICDLQTDQLQGGVGLEINESHHNAELGYWLGREFWNQGLATEAAAAVVKFGLTELGLHKVHAHHLHRNPASGRVLEKIGMRKEGFLRGHVRKWGIFEDVVCFGILAKDLESGD